MSDSKGSKKPAAKKTSPSQPIMATAKPTIAMPVAVKPAIIKSVMKPIIAAPARPSTTSAVAKAVVKPVVAKPVAAKPVAKAKPVASSKPKKVAKKSVKKEPKKDKPEKVKMERDSFTMPKDEYAQLTLLKARLNSMGQPAKKSELLRAGIKLLAAMSDNTLKTTLAKIPVIKTGRPNKKD